MNLNVDLAAVAALLLALVTIAKTFMSSRNDMFSGKGDVLSQLQTFAETTAMKNVDLYKRLVEVEAKACDLQDDLQFVINVYLEWFEGIEKLIVQIRNKQEEPVWEPDPDTIRKLKEKVGK